MENTTSYDGFVQEAKSEGNELNPTQPLIINPEGKSFLITVAKWSNFMAIVGFVMIGLLIISGISVMTLSSVVDEYRDFEMFQYYPMSVVVLGLTNIVVAIISFFPIYYLFQFSEKIRFGMRNNDQESMNVGLKNLKKLTKFSGILTIIYIAIMLLVVPAVLFSIGMIQALAGGIPTM
ncbi:MAG: DUF5362 family protein [Paludibacteraceae bacterium]